MTRATAKVQQYLTCDDVATLLQMPLWTVRKHMRDGRIPAVKVGATWRTTPEALAQALTPHPVTDPAPPSRRRRRRTT